MCCSSSDLRGGLGECVRNRTHLQHDYRRLDLYGLVDSSTTTSVSTSGVRYIGTITPPGQSTLPIDLSLFFGLPRGASVEWSTLALYDVSGGYSTGAAGITGEVHGTLDGTPQDGQFTGTMTAFLANGCVASRSYSGRLSAQALSWSAGAPKTIAAGRAR